MHVLQNVCLHEEVVTGLMNGFWHIAQIYNQTLANVVLKDGRAHQVGVDFVHVVVLYLLHRCTLFRGSE